MFPASSSHGSHLFLCGKTAYLPTYLAKQNLRKTSFEVNLAQHSILPFTYSGRVEALPPFELITFSSDSFIGATEINADSHISIALGDPN